MKKQDFGMIGLGVISKILGLLEQIKAK